MNLVSLPDGRIVNLDYLTHVERTGDYVRGDRGSIIRVKHGEARREFWRISAASAKSRLRLRRSPKQRQTARVYDSAGTSSKRTNTRAGSKSRDSIFCRAVRPHPLF